MTNLNRQGLVSVAEGTDPEELLRRVKANDAHIGVIGLGYVGLPLVKVLLGAGFPVTGFDVDPAKIEALEAGRSYIGHIPAEVIRGILDTGRFGATGDFTNLAKADVIIICVPTPLTRHREPDMSYVRETAEAIRRHLRPGQLIVLESTTYPGTTVEVLRPILEQTGLRCGTDFFLAYSPEREDPGNPQFETGGIPKVVGGDGKQALRLVTALYDKIVISTVPVSNTQTAEAIKLTENIFRAVNIALVNELKLIYGAMDIDVWEVIEAAKTKPFGFMPFYPGPGLGGHCIPIDPFYLTWKAREHGITTQFIELAGQINTGMPRHVVDRLAETLNERFAKSLKGAHVLLVGLAYKKNVDDIRESPAFKIMQLLEASGARVDYHDPFVPEIPPTREHSEFTGRKSIPWTGKRLEAYHAALICTDHDDVDYAYLAENVPLVVDTRNAMARSGVSKANVVKA